MNQVLRPLEGLRILACESFGAGPYGSMFLADLGAEVIKLEDPSTGGDASRGVGPHYLGERDDSQYFQTFNRNKRSIALDLKSGEGQEVLHSLARTSQAVMNNLRGDLPDKLGLTYPKLARINPRIVCAHLSAYGRNNSREARPGYDYLMQAEAGYMALTGEPDGPPTRMGLSIIDFLTGLTGGLALLAAIRGAERSGRGCDIDACLFDVALHQLSYPATWYLNEGTVTTRMPRSAHPSLAPVQLVRTADGWIMVMCMKDRFWERLIETLGCPELGRDPRYATMTARRQNIAALTSELDEVMSRSTTADWLARLGTLLPVAPVLDMPQALDSQWVRDVGMVENVPHPARADLRLLANPLRFDGQRLPGKACQALGADTASLLREIGYSDERISKLAAAGVVKVGS